MIKKIIHNEKILALIVSGDFNGEGIEFFTPPNFSQQLAYMKRPKDYVIQPHIHNMVQREVFFTQEVLIIKKGKVRVDFYDDDKIYLESFILKTGDIALLAFGGHGFEMLEDSEIFEVKQGPYMNELDKVRFLPVQKSDLVVKS